jgi:hypothetical protein
MCMYNKGVCCGKRGGRGREGWVMVGWMDGWMDEVMDARIIIVFFIATHPHTRTLRSDPPTPPTHLQSQHTPPPSTPPMNPPNTHPPTHRPPPPKKASGGGSTWSSNSWRTSASSAAPTPGNPPCSRPFRTPSPRLPITPSRRWCRIWVGGCRLLVGGWWVGCGVGGRKREHTPRRGRVALCLYVLAYHSDVNLTTRRGV